MRHIITAAQLCLMAFPVGLSLYAANTRCAAYGVLSIAAVLAAVAILPLCRRRESIWMFFLLFLTATPLNIVIIKKILSTWLFEDFSLLTNIFQGALLYLIAISIEELACGFFARLIWRRQYKPLLARESLFDQPDPNSADAAPAGTCVCETDNASGREHDI
ncbi:MAG: hypothetical protein E7429_01275 [Ruminococcaceae bacterium]|nr:hypothetical protein [Oscillospiraceae bacterium]